MNNEGARGVVEVVEHLPSKLKTLSSNSNTAKEQNKTEKNKE
jgi:hypothetical protein